MAGNYHEHSSSYSKLIYEYRAQYEAVSGQRLYSSSEAQDLAERVYQVLRVVSAREPFEILEFRGYFEVRPGFPGGFLGVQLQIAPKASVRITRRLQTLVQPDEEVD